MATVKERATAAVIGCLCGDAAAQPIHWIYNLSKLKSILSALEYPEFRFPSANPYYRIDTGKNTCYGDQTMALLESLVRCKGLDVKDFATTQYQYFGPHSEYENKDNAAFVLKSGLQKNFPIHGAWRNQVIKDFLVKYAAGDDETGSDKVTDMHAIIQVVPVVALYAGQPEMLDKVVEAVSVTMTAEEALVHSLVAARILEYFILNGSEGDALEEVLRQLKDPNRTCPHSLDKALIGFIGHVKRKLTDPHFKAATSIFKNNWYLPGAFQSALHALLNSTDYAEGIRLTMQAGGCNASRSAFIGACLAARNGIQNIPEDWKTKTLCSKKAMELCKELMDLRKDA